VASINVSDFYRPNQLQETLHKSPAVFQCAWGGADSGKSWWARAEGLFLSYDFPDNEGFVLRYSGQELKDFSIPSYIEFAQKMGIFLDFKVGSGGVGGDMIVATRNPEVTSVIKFRSIKEAGAKHEQSSKFGSTEIGWFHIEEAQDPRIKETVWHMLIKRLRRHKDKSDPLYIAQKRGMVTCNPPTPDHWCYRVFWPIREKESGIEGDYQIYLTKTTDNIDQVTKKPLYDEANLKRMLASYSPAWQQVYIYGKPAFIPMGRPVWSNFDYSLNAGEFDPVMNRTVIRSWDFGRRRACTLFVQLIRIRDEKIYGLQTQRPPLDRITYLRELLFEGKTVTRMIHEVLAFSNVEFPDYKFEDIGDYAGTQKKAEFEKSCWDILKEHKIKIRGKPMQYIREKCIDAIDEKMAHLVQGEPLLQVDEKRCPVLTEALSGSWTRNDKGIPSDDNFYEHPSDCAIFVVANYLLTGQNARPQLKISVPKYGSSYKGTRRYGEESLVVRG